MKRPFYARFGKVIVLAAALFFPVSVVGAILALATNRNDVQEWLPESFIETQNYQKFQKHFQNDTFIFASWDGCTLEDARLDALAARLSPGGEKSDPGSKYFEKVQTGRSLMAQLTSPPIRLKQDAAAERLSGCVIGDDGEQTCAVMTLSRLGKDNLHPTVDAIYQAAAECDIPRANFRIGGPSVDNVSIDQEGERMLLPLMGLCGTVGLGLTWWYLRDIRLTLMVFIGGVYAAFLSLTIVKFCGGTMNSILLSMPPVVYTAGLACAIHMVNYYRHARAQHGLEGAPELGLKAAWLPCMLSAGTTSLGLVSLMTSDLVPIRNFGMYTALGVMATIAFMYLYLPSALYLWPPAELATAGHDSGLLDPGHRRRMRWIARRVIARPLVVWTVFMVVMSICGTGLYRAKTTVNLMSLFSHDAEIIHSYLWLEKKLGPLIPMEVVVRLHDSNLSFIERMELITRLEKEIAKIDEVGSTMSAATFAPELTMPSRQKGLRGVFVTPTGFRRTLNQLLERHREDFADYLVKDEATGDELWRINVRVPALQGIDYGSFNKEIKSLVDPALATERERGVTGIVDVTYTGLTPVVYRAERVLLEGLIESFFWAFLMIGIVMSIVFRDVRAGFYTMLPNVWPVAVVFGMMGWLNIVLDIGTMMTASVAMGVCVDDTVHFANWFRRATRLGLDRQEAVVLAYENSAGAIYQSTVIVALGLVTFAISSFMPTQRFGYLMCTLLGFGLVADLVLTPAMLSGPIGRFFTGGCKPPPEEEPQFDPAQNEVHSSSPAHNNVARQGAKHTGSAHSEAAS